MRPLILLACMAFLVSKAQFLSRQLQSCPKVTTSNSYTIAYGKSSQVIIPSVVQKCLLTNYMPLSIDIYDSGVPSMNLASMGIITSSFYINYDYSTYQIQVTNWQTFALDAYYNLTLQIKFAQTFNTATQVLVQSQFFLVFGSVPIQFSPLGYTVYSYSQSATLNYQTAFDPNLPAATAMSYALTCDPLFVGCSSLQGQSLVTFTPLSLIQNNRIVFNRQYNFTMTLSTAYPKTALDKTGFIVKSPLLSGDAPLSCLGFSLNFKNSLSVYSQTKNNVTLMFNNNNFTTVSYGTPTVVTSNCATQYGSNLATVLFTSFENPALLGDMRSYVFNNTPITFSSSVIQAALSIGNQSITSYALLYNSKTNVVLGYQYVTVKMSSGTQTIFAQFAQPFVQVGAQNILYIDGSPSLDYLGNASSSFTYYWSLNGYPGISFPNNWVLSVPPSVRNFYGINQPGKYYYFTLTVQYGTRYSLPSQVVVQITPELDPNLCVSLSQKSINVTQIMAYTSLPLLLQIVVTKNQSCSGIDLDSLMWSCKDVPWQFWQTIGNNNTIGVSRQTLQKLPKSKNISLIVTQYYTVSAIEYISQLQFTMFVQTENLVAIIDYPQVFNPRDYQWLVIDASASNDPVAEQMNTTNVPVVCSWTCSTLFSFLCTAATLTNNGCKMSIPSVLILSQSNYASNLAGQMQQFSLKITKDTRATTKIFYVTIIDTNYFPRCSLTLQGAQDQSINEYQYVNTVCVNALSAKSSTFTYSWGLYMQQTQVLLTETSQLVTNQQNLRIPPYILSQYSNILIKLLVTANGMYTTPIGLFFQENDQQYFTQGQINVNYNSFTAYLSPFVLAPQAWYSALSSELLFQYRIKEGVSNYRVLMSPQTDINQLPITSYLPPLTYDNNIYVDVIDTLGNYVTVQQPLASRANILMTATQFAINVNSITQKIVYTFSEIDLESSIYQLRLYFMAYELSQLDQQGQPIAYFTILSQSAIQYLYNTFVVEQRLKQVTSFERAALINQHIIEIVYSITQLQRSAIGNTSVQQALTLVNQAVKTGEYTLGNTLPEISSKLFQIAFNTFEANSAINGTGKLKTYDYILNQVLADVQYYLYSGETITSSTGPFSFSVTKLSTSTSSFQTLSSFSYSQQEVLSRISNPAQAMMVLAKNATYVFAQFYDGQLNQLKMSLLTNPVMITFTMSSSQLTSYNNGTLKIFCASRNGFSDAWTNTTISMLSLSQTTGAVQCSANHFSQYALFMVSTVIPQPVLNITNVTVDPTKITNQTSGNGTAVIVGSWNSSLPNSTVINSQTNLNVKAKVDSRTINYAALGVLIFFIGTHFFFRYRYKGENQEHLQRDHKFQFAYQTRKSKCRNFMRLFGLTFINFNPYLNIFLVYNKFVPRWTRNLIIQNYFMAISMGFGIYACLATESLAETDPTTLIGIFFLIVIVVIFIRPWTIKVLYKLLYEPYSRVEDFQDNDSPDNMKSNSGILVGEADRDFEVQQGIRIDISEDNPNNKVSFLKKAANTNHDHQKLAAPREETKQSSVFPSIFAQSVISILVNQSKNPFEDPSKLPQINLRTKSDFAQFSRAIDEIDIDGKGIKDDELQRSDEEIVFKKASQSQKKAKKRKDQRHDTDQQDGSARDAMLEKYRQLLDNGEALTDEERRALMEEMAERLDRMNKQLRKERGDQDMNLDEALAARRKKREGLKAMLDQATLSADSVTQDYMKRLYQLALDQEEQLAKMEEDIARERLHALQKLDRDLQSSRDEKLAEIEGQIEKLRKSGANPQELAELLEQYRRLALKVDQELATEREKQAAALEAKLKKKREKMLKEFEKLWKELERLESGLLNENAALRNEIAQIKQLVKPVDNEVARLQALLSEKQLEEARLETEEAASKEAAANYQRKIELIGEEEDAKVNRIMDDIKQSGDKALRDQELKRQGIQAKLADTTNTSPEERRRLMMQLDAVNKAIDDYQKRAASEQDSRLEEALQNRRKRKQQAVEDLNNHKQEKLLDECRAKAERFLQTNFGASLKDPSINDAQVKDAFEQLASVFSDEEMVQAIEHYLEQKSLHETQQVQLYLQRQRAESLKVYVFQLMLQKQTQFELIREEYQPRFKLLEEHRSKGLLASEAAYHQQLGQLREEETAKKLDAELQLNEVEHKLEEELAVQALQAKAQAESTLKTRQARERALMLDLLLQRQQDGSLQQYLRNARRDIEQELAEHKKQLDAELERKLKEINDARAQRERELEEKEAQLLGWEQRLRDEEAKQAALFKRQKQALMARKKAEQSSELQGALSIGQIEAMKYEHMRAMLALESAIEQEQKRQMALMQSKLKARIIEGDQEKVRRQVKLSMLIQEKEKLQAESSMRLKKQSPNGKHLPAIGKKTMKPLKIQEINDSYEQQQRARKTQGPSVVNFYDGEARDDLSGDGDLQHQFEGGDQDEEEEKKVELKNFSDNTHELDLSSVPNARLDAKINDDFVVGGTDSNERRYLRSPKGNKVCSEDTMSQTHQTSGAIYSPRGQPFFISKFIGKAIVVLMWMGLMASNMIAVTQMDEEQFKNWIVLSIVAFFSIIFVIDPVIYLVLTFLMLKKQFKLVTPEGFSSRDSIVDYFTSRSREDRYRCSRFFVVALVGSEKMKDLKRRLNPQDPL